VLLVQVPRQLALQVPALQVPALQAPRPLELMRLVFLVWSLLGDLLLTGDCNTLALAGAGICMGPLATHREPLAVAESLITADLDLPLDVLCNFAPKVALNPVIGVDELADLQDLSIGEIANFRVVVNFKSTEDLIRPRTPDPKDIGKANLDSFVPWEIYSGNSCHMWLPLSLLVARVFTDHPDAAMPPDNPTLLAHLLS
jgi:hypothetical protein